MTSSFLPQKRGWIPYLLAIAALLILLWYLIENSERFLSLLQLSPALILSLAGLALATAVANGLINRSLFQALNVSLVFSEAIGLAMANTLANQLPFSGGLVAKGVYLKQRYQLAYSQYLSATMALYVFSISISGLTGLLALSQVQYLDGATVNRAWLLLIGFLVMAALGLVLFLPLRAKRLPASWRSHFRAIATGWEVLRHKHTVAIRLAVIQVVGVFIVAGRYWIAFHAFSQDVSIAQCILFSAGTVLTQLVSITPGGLGVREGIVAAISTVLGFDPGIAVVAVALDRLVATTVIIVGGVFSTYFLSKKAALNSGSESSSVAIEEPKTS